MIPANRITNWPHLEGDPRKAAERLEDRLKTEGLANVNLEAWLAGYATAVWSAAFASGDKTPGG